MRVIRQALAMMCEEKILEVYAHSGDSVDVGTPLLRLDLQSAETTLRTAQLQLQQLRQQYQNEQRVRQADLRIRNGSFYSGPGDYTLFILEENLLRPRQVRLGECNYDYIEVISGLEQGEQVVVSDMTKYKGKEKLKVD